MMLSYDPTKPPPAPLWKCALVIVAYLTVCWALVYCWAWLRGW